MTLPTPQESASMLIASIRHLIPANHNTLAEIMIAAAQHIEADRAAHCRHVTAGEYYTPRTYVTETLKKIASIMRRNMTPGNKIVAIHEVMKGTP